MDETRLAVDAAEIAQLSETIASSTSVALAPYLSELHKAGMRKVALRVTLGPEQVTSLIPSSHGGHPPPSMTGAVWCCRSNTCAALRERS